MDSFSEESEFFDALEQISPQSDIYNRHCIRNWEYDVWTSRPRSVRERRMDFIRRLGLSPHESEVHTSVKTYWNNKDDDVKADFDRIMEDSGAVLRNPCLEQEHKFFSNSSSMSSLSTEDSELSHEVGFCECGHENGSSDLEREGVMNFSQCSCGAQHLEHEEDKEGNECSPQTMDKLKDKWLSKLRNMTCVFSRNVKDAAAELDGIGHVQGTSMKRIKVNRCRKQLKELSGLFTGQDIYAHNGSISVMKFSPDGHYLASAGEDKIVKIWLVVEDERSDTIDIPDADPSCVYFSLNYLSELGPLVVEKDGISKSKSLRKTSDSACIILPPKVFRILEKPLHVFQGHSGEILDISWSKNNYLLSSSIDKTVRLWRVGNDQCLRVFSHTDYVTCIQFNPVNDGYFISGSIDGKLRVWEISGCHVVEWTETKEIITAVCYRPDGEGGIIGFITGNIRFFNTSDSHIQLETQMCLTSKKKPPCKRITGFQFLEKDPRKVLVTCSDSQVRIIDGMEVIAKYKCSRNTGNHISASFTSDNKHIISASEDSNIYIWNYIDQDESSLSQPKSIRSFECFPCDASVAITWPGFKTGNTEDNNIQKSRQSYVNTIRSLPFSSSTDYFFSSTREYFHSDSSSKVSATWPEEKLPPTSSPPPLRGKTSEMGKSHYKLFKTSCQSLSDSHMWGQVIVTGGYDGRIKSFHSYGLPLPL